MHSPLPNPLARDVEVQTDHDLACFHIANGIRKKKTGANDDV